MVHHVSIIDRDPSAGIAFKKVATFSIVSFLIHLLAYDTGSTVSFGDAASPWIWLACKVPLWTTGFSNFALLLWTNSSYNELFSNREEPCRGALEGQKIRTSINPAREERLHSLIEIVSYAAGLTFSSDILIAWYQLVEFTWAESQKSQTDWDDWVVFLFTVFAVILLFLTWIPSYKLRRFGKNARSDKKLFKGRQRMKAILDEARRIHAQEGIEKWWNTLERAVSIAELGTKYSFEEYDNERTKWRNKLKFNYDRVNMTRCVNKSVEKARNSTAMLEELLIKVSEERKTAR